MGALTIGDRVTVVSEGHTYLMQVAEFDKVDRTLFLVRDREQAAGFWLRLQEEGVRWMRRWPGWRRRSKQRVRALQVAAALRSE